MTIHEAYAICRALGRAGISSKVVEHSGDRAEIAVLGIYAFKLNEVMEEVEEHFPGDLGCERLLSEIEASGTFDEARESTNLREA